MLPLLCRWVLQQAGLVAGSVIIVVMMFCTCWTCQIVVRYKKNGAVN